VRVHRNLSKHTFKSLINYFIDFSIQKIKFSRPSSGVDFAELLRQASEKKRAEAREERRRKQQVRLSFLETFNIFVEFRNILGRRKAATRIS